MEEYSFNDSNASLCYVSQFDGLDFKVVAAIRLLTAFLSLACAVSVIIVIIAHQKFKFFLQMLIFYLSVAVVLRSVSHIVGRLDYMDGRELMEPFCTYFMGFLDLYTSWVELIALIFIIVNIFTNVFMEMDITDLKLPPLLVMLLLPLLWCWVPYISLSFGIQGPWCGIRIHTDDCRFFLAGNWMRFGLWEIPLFVMFFLGFMVIIVAIIVKVQKERKEYSGHRYDPNKMEAKQKTSKSIYPLICYPFIYLVLNLPHLVGNVCQSFQLTDNILAVWVLDALLTPLAGGVMVLAYTFDSHTRKTLKKGSVRQVMVSCFKNCFGVCIDRDWTVTDYHCEAENRFGDSLSGEYQRRTMYVRHERQRERELTEVQNGTVNVGIVVKTLPPSSRNQNCNEQ